MPGSLDSGEEEFNLGPEMRLGRSEPCVIRFSYSIKEIEKASDIGIRRGQKVLLLVLAIELYTCSN